MSEPVADVRLRSGRERSVLQGHPWILSGSVADVRGEPGSGATVRVLASDGRPLALGDYDPDSQIRVRLTRFATSRTPPSEPLDDDPRWFEERLADAIAWRMRHPLLQDTDSLRLVHAESDGLPGLTIDRYARWLVVRPGTAAMLRRVLEHADALQRLTSADGAWLRGDVQRPLDARVLFGRVPEETIAIRERGRVYGVDLRRGQKTGFYLDQRDARDLFARLASGARALDLFAYTGGFSVAALAGGAQSVVAIDSSGPACAMARANAPAAQVIEADVREFLRGEGPRFDLIALDPPPLAKRQKDVPAASRAYKDLNLWALRRAEVGAHILTFSCSHHVDSALFAKIVAGAARDASRGVQILTELRAPPDHPVSAQHPQSQYLTGVLLRVCV